MTTYAILMETNGGECESWYYFIKYDGNEKELKYLKKQIDKIDMFIIDELSTFDIDLKHLNNLKLSFNNMEKGFQKLIFFLESI